MRDSWLGSTNCYNMVTCQACSVTLEASGPELSCERSAYSNGDQRSLRAIKNLGNKFSRASRLHC